MYFRKYISRKTPLDKCLKSLLLEHHLAVNMLKGTKHLWNLHDSTFVRFLHHYEENLLRKCLS